MIDFVKIKVLNPDINALRELPFLEWEQKTNTRTGEIKEYRTKFNGLTIVIINNQYTYISGSLHKYWNITNTGKDQNYNDFTFSSLDWTIQDISDRFNLNLVNCKIENIETGVNVISPFPVNEVLRSIINHKGNPFTQEHSEKKYFRECEYQRYFVKVYNKGLQFDQHENILRFELKYVKMNDLKPYGIITLEDMTDKGKISRLLELLQGNFNGLLFYDSTIQETDLTPPELYILTKGRIPTYWSDLKETNRENYYKKRNRFRELVNKYGKQNIQETIGNLITQKWNDLLQPVPKTLQELTDPVKLNFTEINTSSIGLKPVNLIQGEELQTTNTPERVCLSCGRNISNQKDDSKFCSAKFVGEEQAHKCRNENSNPRNNLKNMIERDKERGLLFLFDTVPMLTERKLHNFQIG